MATTAEDDGDEATRAAGTDGRRPSGLLVAAVVLGAITKATDAGVPEATALLSEDLDELGLLDAFTATGPVTIAGSPTADPLVAVTRDVDRDRSGNAVAGAWHWHLADGEAGARTIAIAGPAERVVRVLGARSGLTPPPVASWERLHRPSTLRWFRPGALLDDATGRDVSPVALDQGRSLLFLHDVFGRSLTSFFGLPAAVHAELDRRYGGRLWAFEHPTMSVTPAENARALLALLFPEGTGDVVLELDVVAHGRGTNVADELLRASDGRLRIGCVVAAGAPIDGTPLARPEHLVHLLDAATTIAARTSENPLTTTVDALGAAAIELGRDPSGAGLPGVTAMAAPIPRSAGMHLLAGRTTGLTVEGLAGDHDGVVPVPRSATDDEIVDASHRGLWSAAERILAWLAPPSPPAPASASTERSGEPTATAAPAPPRRRLTKRTTAPVTVAQPLRLSVLHASVEHADHAVVVGHFRGAELTQSEELLDARLGGLLSQWRLARRYPEAIGQVLELRNSGPVGQLTYPPAVLIIGLGAPGGLTRAGLTEAVAAGILEHALTIADDRTTVRPPDIAVSARLIGTTGRSALPVDVVVAAIVDAALAVNAKLFDLVGDRVADPSARVRIGHVQFVERSADRAELASRAVTAIDDLVLVSSEPHTTLRPDPRVTDGAGAWPRRSLADEPPGWQRFMVHTARDGDRTELSFTMMGSRASTEQMAITVDNRAVQVLLDRARNSDPDGAVATALFELLVPRSLRDDVASADNLQFIVDAGGAALPWEALIGAQTGVGAGRPISRRGGFIRQFDDTEGHRGDVSDASGRRALVIGNPPGDPTSYPPLPAAYDEAVAVAEQLGAAGIETTSLVWPAPDGDAPAEPSGAAADSGADVLAAMTGEVRILHIAGHGDMRPAATGRRRLTGGVVIGPGMFLTAADVLQRRTVPELVFLNCCNLGAQLEQAANLARAFMTRGAQAVIAAGWPVNDEAAKAFADRFYLDMLAGETFGTAVQRARRQAHAVRPHSLTWAAYQCYGDPGYRLEVRRRRSSAVGQAVSESEFVRQLKMLGTSISDIGRPDADRMARARLQLRTALDELAHRAGEWRSAVVDYELAVAYAELGEFASAITHYQRTLEARKALAPMKAVEQLGNLQIRLAQETFRRTDTVTDEVTALADAARRNLRRALLVGPTSERFALVGSYHKKRATFDVARRAFHLSKSADAYWRAHQLDPDDSYPLLNFLQLHVLIAGTLPASERVADVAEAIGRIEAKIDATTDDAEGFWGVSARGSAGLTRLIAGDLLATSEKVPTAREPATIAGWYLDAFKLRSSWRERRSCVDHLDDLIALCGEGHAALGPLREIRDELADWTRRTIGTDE